MFFRNRDGNDPRGALEMDLLERQAGKLTELLSLISVAHTNDLTAIGEYGRNLLVEVAPDLETRYSQIEAVLESSLALMYTALIHTKGYTGLHEARDELFQRARGKVFDYNLHGRIVIELLEGVSFYIQGASKILKKEPVESEFATSQAHLTQALRLSKGYSPDFQKMALFNLGRVEFVLGTNASDYFAQIQDDDHPLRRQLTSHYQENMSHLGIIIEDPQEIRSETARFISQIPRY